MFLLFGSESGSMSEAMVRTVEGTRVVFLRQITGKRVWITIDGMWETLAIGEFLRADGMQKEATYIGCRQGTVAQWVALHLIFEGFSWKKGFEGGGRWRKPWW